MYFDVGIYDTFENIESSEYTGFCLTTEASLEGSPSPVQKAVKHNSSKRIYNKIEVKVLLEDVKSLQLKKFSDYEVLSVKISDEETFKYACSTWDVDIIKFDLSRMGFSFRGGYVRKAINRGVFFEIEVRDALYGTKERVSWMRNAQSILRITKGRGIVITSGARCCTEIKSIQDMYKILRFLGLSHRRAEMVLKENSQRLLKSCALKRYTFKGCVANDLEEGNLKQDFILKEFGL